jgi:ketol-acid reductoisomerase
MDGVLADVRDGSFVKRVMADYDAGSPELLARRKALGERTIEAVGAHLNGVATRAG